MHHSAKWCEACRLQNNDVYKVQSIQFSTTFKNEYDKKVDTHTSCDSTELK